jgi:hypothetical protein
MEISYLEIFHKQGILGLIFWSYVFTLLVKRYLSAKKTDVAHAFFYGTLFVFFQSLTNQFINNPIGLSMLLVTLVVLDVLRKDEPVIAGGHPSTKRNQKSDALLTGSF